MTQHEGHPKKTAGDKPDYPSLGEWLAMPREAIAREVWARRLTVMIWLDGTRRHYLLSRPDLGGQIHDFDDYARHGAAAYVRVYELLFSLGVHTVVDSPLYPPNFQRGETYLRKGVAANRRLVLGEPFAGFYARARVRARIFGDYELAPAAATVRTELADQAASLALATPEGERRILFGYRAGSFAEEMAARAGALAGALGRAPTAEELQIACFPDGPEAIDILILGGWLRVGHVLPPLLDGGRTDIYDVPHLAIDLQEGALRRILHDHLFLRRAVSEDGISYTAEDLRALSAHYAAHDGCVLGVGHLVGPGVWHPEHAHGPDGSP
ncbi:MAG: hypothetical protein QM820_21925 [Minicystis sp.]